MFKDVSIWCLILGVVILMFVHHILSDKPLFEGNENIQEEESTEATEGDSTVETEEATVACCPAAVVVQLSS